MRTRAAALGAALLLSACSDSSSTSGGAAAAPLVDPAMLCLASSCGSKIALVDIPSAENSLYTPEGRLFVSGGQNVYEITHPDSSWTATPLYAGSCNFTGLAQRGNVLYAACFDGHLYAGRIDVPAPALASIYDMGLNSPNGMTSGPSGELYVVNGPLPTSSLPDPKIVRLTFGNDPLTVTAQSDWLTLTAGVDFPNGIQRVGSTLYFSASAVVPVNLGGIRSVTINTDGSAGAVSTVLQLPGLPDDFSIIDGSYFLAAVYSNNQVELLDGAGNVIAQSAIGSFDNPSSVKLGRAPLFAPDDIVVTEKGVIGLPPTPGYGNRLSVFRKNSS